MRYPLELWEEEGIKLLAPSLWGGSGTLPLNLTIQAGGLHSLHPHSTKCFMGRAWEGWE